MKEDSPPMAQSFPEFQTDRQPRYALLAIAATVLLTLVLMAIGAPLVTQAAPRGIVSFELARSVPAVGAILGSWSPTVRLSAALSLGIDYLYIPVYAATFWLLCRLASRRMERLTCIGARLGVVLAWSMPAAGILDGIENYALVRVLFGDVSTLWVETAWLCASVKFALLGLAGLYGLIALWFELLVILRKRRNQARF